jgi:hypothetical protein
MGRLMDEVGHHPPFFQPGIHNQYNAVSTGEIYLQSLTGSYEEQVP